jgi:hypothetical protein
MQQKIIDKVEWKKWKKEKEKTSIFVHIAVQCILPARRLE